MPDTNLTFRITDEMRAQIETIARAEDRPVAYVIRALLGEALAARAAQQ